MPSLSHQPPAAGPRFLCIGAAHRDVLGRAAAEHVPPGADLPGSVTQRPGGVALNIAFALAGLSQPVALLASLGADGGDLAADAVAAGIDCRHLCRHPGPTDRYLAIEDARGELVAAVADCSGLERHWPDLVAAAGRIAGRGTLVLDGNLPAAAVARLGALPGPVAAVAASPAKARHLEPLLGRPATCLYLNRSEAEALAGCGLPDAAAAVRHILALGAAAVVVTDGPATAAAATARAPLVTVTPADGAVQSVTGAGDRLVAAHLAALADGLPPEAALRAAVAAASGQINCRPLCKDAS